VITDYKVNNFVLDADIEYGSASDTADWLWSGCGFVYGLQDPYNYTVAWVALDGNVYATHVLKGDLTGKFLTWKRWGKPDLPTGTAKVRIVVFDKRLTIFVNDQKVTSAYDGLTEPGEFAMLVLSGTNKGYGTRCKMSNLNLWMFDE
jgi:hypothetical protein